MCEVRSMGGRLGLMLLGDEYAQAPSFLYEESDYLFKNYFFPSQLAYSHVTFIPLGYKSGYWNQEEKHVGQRRNWMLEMMEEEEAQDHGRGRGRRKFRWNFVGNVYSSESRLDMMEAIDSLGADFSRDAHMNLTTMWNDFSRGMATRSYRDLLLRSDFTLCPGGGNVETYRVSEALEAGSIPVLESSIAFEHIYPGHPFPYISDFSRDLGPVLLESEENLGELRKEVFSYWWELKGEIRKKLSRCLRGRKEQRDYGESWSCRYPVM